MNRRRSKFIVACICFSTLLSSLLSATGNVYVSQMESEIDPKVMCFPSSMINASICAGYDLDTSVLDVYDTYIHSDVIQTYINSYAPRYISRTLNYNDVDVREMWQIEEMAFNSFMGFKVCELKTHVEFKDVVNEIESGNTLVISGKLVGRSHCVTVTTITDETVTFIDPYGDPNTRYRNTDKYAIVSMDKNDFMRSFKQDDGKYTYISFKRIEPNTIIADDQFYSAYNRCMRDVIATEYMVYDSVSGFDVFSDFELAEINRGYSSYIKFSKDTDKIVSYLSYKTLLENDSCVFTPLVLNDIINVSVSSDSDPVLSAYMKIYSHLTSEPINLNYLSSAYKSSDDIETRFYISCIGYERYLFGTIPDYVEDLYSRISEIITPFIDDLNSIKFIDLSFIEKYHLFSIESVNADVENGNSNDRTDTVLSVYYLYFIDNRRKLLDRICERTGKGYSLKNFSEFVITF